MTLDNSKFMKSPFTFAAFELNPTNPTEEEKKEIENPNGMRKRIDELSRYDPLVRNVLSYARHQGLSGEDKYLLLAFHALDRAQRLEKSALRIMATSTEKYYVLVDK